MIIKPLAPQTLPFALALTINEEQSQFANSVSTTLKNLKSTEHPCVISIDERPDSVVGFFLFDTAYASQHDFAQEGDLGLRALLIGNTFQGKGLGYKSMLAIPHFAREHYANYTHICLTVNEKNTAAYHCYLKAGYQDDKQRYLGGAAGPQHILRLALSNH